MTTKRRKPLFERLKQGLEEGIAHVQGELTPEITLKQVHAKPVTNRHRKVVVRSAINKK